MTESGFSTSRAGQRIITSSNEDLSEYTDAEESISAPTEILAEFLSSLMQKDYASALKYCKLMLQYEPNNCTAKELYPLLVEKLEKVSMSDDEPVSSSSEENDDEISPKSSNSNQNDDEDTEDEDEEEDEELSDSDKTSSLENSCESPIIEVDNPKDNMNNSRIDSDGTTNSYSSLEDEEVLRDDNILEEVIVERTYLDDANGNNVIWKTNTVSSSKYNPKWLWEIEETNSNTLNIPLGTQIQTSSDSESPTDPVTQQSAQQMLRANFVHAAN